MGSYTLDRHPEDGRVPEPGDLLVATKAVYRITDVRPVDTRLNLNRWRLTTTRVATVAGRHPGPPERCWWQPEVRPDVGRAVIFTSRYGGEPVAHYWARHGVQV